MRKIGLFILAFMFMGLVVKAQAHKIGDKFGGGVVFSTIDGGAHGLIAETQDQGKSKWKDAPALIAVKENHSAAGKAFKDWRLPTKDELNKLFKKKDIVGGFVNSAYWSSTELDNNFAFDQFFEDGNQTNTNKSFTMAVRSIRSF